MMRLVDVAYAVPFLFVVILLIAILRGGPGAGGAQAGPDRLVLLFVVIGAISWLTMARVVRGQVLVLRRAEFVQAARALGASPVRVALPNSDPRRLVAVPRDALVVRGSEMFVLRVTSENTVERVDVDTGIGLGSLVEVIGDVSGGDRVVTRGAERLQPGQSVTIAES